MITPVEKEQPTDRQQRAFFTDLGLRSMSAMRLHNRQGLWERDNDRKREWSNVTSHCLVEAARVEVFAEVLNLSEDVKNDLVTAAAVHDFYKKEEIKKLAENDDSWDAYNEAQVEAKAILDASSLSRRSILLATAVGHQTIPEAESILAKDSLDETDIAWLVMHYVDDYTINSDPVTPATIEDGKPVNDFMRRIDRNRAAGQPGGKYFGINQGGIEHFGELSFDAMERVGLMVQERLAQLVSSATHSEVSPVSLPEFIDQHLADDVIKYSKK